MKIAYIFTTLAKTGGTERIISQKASYYADIFGYDVTIINCFQRDQDANHYPISKKIKQINLGIPYFSQYRYKYPKRFWVKWQVNKQLNNSIRQYVQKVDSDILIGISYFKADVVSTVKCRAKKIIECHEAKQFTHSNFKRKRTLLTYLFLNYRRFSYFRTIEHNADAIITLTDGDKTQWKHSKYIDVIPNFSTMPVTKYSDCTYKRIIAVGRLEWEKGYERLIKIWKLVVCKHPDWQLDIFGEGKLKTDLGNRINEDKIKNINLNGVTHDISKEYATSSICVVTSRFEGFSLVILEAMKHALPCIAFDCPYGPRSIIDDGCNGFLVEDGNIGIFAEKLCRLIEDEELRLKFSKSAKEKALFFNPNSIMNEWKILLERINSNS